MKSKLAGEKGSRDICLAIKTFGRSASCGETFTADQNRRRRRWHPIPAMSAYRPARPRIQNAFPAQFIWRNPSSRNALGASIASDESSCV